MPKTITIADILAYGPCRTYTPERLAELFDGRKSMSIDEILATDIPADHKLDCLLRSGLIDGAKVKKRLGKEHEPITPAAAITASHVAKLSSNMTREERRRIIEAEAASQLAELLND